MASIQNFMYQIVAAKDNAVHWTEDKLAKFDRSNVVIKCAISAIGLVGTTLAFVFAPASSLGMAAFILNHFILLPILTGINIVIAFLAERTLYDHVESYRNWKLDFYEMSNDFAYKKNKISIKIYGEENNRIQAERINPHNRKPAKEAGC